ncbi:MAG: hypothetical protein IKA22_02530, partial [Lentisphaeria bacterium]|nr:hypothetical protein [Lentisphaeria bacterium]
LLSLSTVKPTGQSLLAKESGGRGSAGGRQMKSTFVIVNAYCLQENGRLLRASSKREKIRFFLLFYLKFLKNDIL